MHTSFLDEHEPCENDKIIGDYLDALLSTPMPVRVFKNRFQLQLTIKLEEILSGRRKPSKHEAVLILLTTLRLSRQLQDNKRVQSRLLIAAAAIVTYLDSSSAK